MSRVNRNGRYGGNRSSNSNNASGNSRGNGGGGYNRGGDGGGNRYNNNSGGGNNYSNNNNGGGGNRNQNSGGDADFISVGSTYTNDNGLRKIKIYVPEGELILKNGDSLFIREQPYKNDPDYVDGRLILIVKKN